MKTDFFIVTKYNTPSKMPPTSPSVKDYRSQQGELWLLEPTTVKFLGTAEPPLKFIFIYRVAMPICISS